MTEDVFEKAFAHTIGLEGGYVNDSNDSGGATKFGITEKVAREHGYQGDMKNYPLESAKEIYRSFYWNPLNLDTISDWSPEIASEMFDSGVNMGVGKVARFFQEALNVMNMAKDGKTEMYPEMDVDGKIGHNTTLCLSKLQNDIDKRVILKLLECQQGSSYLQIAKINPKNKKFLRGWVDKRIQGIK